MPNAPLDMNQPYTASRPGTDPIDILKPRTTDFKIVTCPLEAQAVH